MIATSHIEKLLGAKPLPDRWTLPEYAALKNKHPCQCVREITVQMKKGEVLRVDSKRDKHGHIMGIYQYAN